MSFKGSNSITDIFRTVFVVASRIEGEEDDRYSVLVMSKAPDLQWLRFLKGQQVAHNVHRFVWSKDQMKSIVGDLRRRNYYVYAYSFKQFKEWSFPLLDLPLSPRKSEPTHALDKIASDLPDARLYVEMFAGNSPLFCALDPYPVEVLNDYDGRLVSFFRTLRDPESFHWFCLLTFFRPPLQRMEDHLFGEFISKVEDDLIGTYLFYMRMWQVFAAHHDELLSTAAPPLGLPEDPTKRILYALQSVDPLLTRLHNRIYRTQVESIPPEKLLHIYDSEDTVFWVDLPRKFGDGSRSYLQGFIELLSDVKGSVVIYSEQQTGNPDLDTLMRQDKLAQKLKFSVKRYGVDTAYRKNI